MAERRVDRAFKAVADAILKNAQSLQGPNWTRVMPIMPNSRIEIGKTATVTAWMAPDAPPRHIPEMLEQGRQYSFSDCCRQTRPGQAGFSFPVSGRHSAIECQRARRG